MPQTHLLNVGEGDCTIIEHNSGRLTMIDICNGNSDRQSAIAKSLRKAALVIEANQNAPGNYRMCERTTNPLDYLTWRGFGEIWRFILTHPDMDHLDGFDALNNEFVVQNFWHTGVDRPKPEFSDSVRFKEVDWDRYVNIRDGNENVTSLLRLAGQKFELANSGGENDAGDYLAITSPNQALVDEADGSKDWNDTSFIIVHRMAGGNAVYCGDAWDGAMAHAIEKYPNTMKDVGFLLAPHHGRDSGRSYDFLDHLKPRFTLIGCADHQHHSTEEWRKRNLDYCKQNQCGNMLIKPSNDDTRIDIYIENKKFADNCGSDTTRTLYGDEYYYFKTV